MQRASLCPCPQAAGAFSSLDGLLLLKCPTVLSSELGKLRAAQTQQDEAEHPPMGEDGPPVHHAHGKLGIERTHKGGPG